MSWAPPRRHFPGSLQPLPLLPLSPLICWRRCRPLHRPWQPPLSCQAGVSPLARRLGSAVWPRLAANRRPNGRRMAARSHLSGGLLLSRSLFLSLQLWPPRRRLVSLRCHRPGRRSSSSRTARLTSPTWWTLVLLSACSPATLHIHQQDLQ